MSIIDKPFCETKKPALVAGFLLGLNTEAGNIYHFL
jgi:hypothetical protein